MVNGVKKILRIFEESKDFLSKLVGKFANYTLPEGGEELKLKKNLLLALF